MKKPIVPESVVIFVRKLLNLTKLSAAYQLDIFRLVRDEQLLDLASLLSAFKDFLANTLVHRHKVIIKFQLEKTVKSRFPVLLSVFLSFCASGYFPFGLERNSVWTP